MDKYVCDICGYVYDPAKGDPANGVAPGTAFADLPESWVCPDCGATVDDFEKSERNSRSYNSARPVSRASCCSA
jgi:rubredoxin